MCNYLSLISISNRLSWFHCVSLPATYYITVFACTGILNEVMSRLHFDMPVGAGVMQSGRDRKPATHFVNEDLKLLADTTVKKGTMSPLPHSLDICLQY